MTPERWREIKAVLGQALELPITRRDEFLDLTCGADAELRAEVDSLLLAAESSSGSFPAARAAVAHASDAALQSALEAALGEQYEIVRPLGRGGMGAVYLARERTLERFVAIKVLRPDLAELHDGRERFRREARVAAQLSHPGILPLHAFGELGGIWYFVMGYVRGVSLAERLRVEGRLPPEEAHRILSELADALECAHRAGVVHRDIKPANILLDEDSGRAILADFGISKVRGSADGLTVTGMIIGSPHFMSPEQAEGSPHVDERSDVYSLGAVGYTMLAGREPFAGVDADVLARWRVTHDPPSLQSVAASLPPELASVMMRCLAREPALRWPDARSLKEALGLAGGEAGRALPETLRDLPTFGPYALLWAVGWTTFAIRTLHAPLDRALLLLIALLVPVGLMLHLWNVGRPEVGALRLARIAFWPPEWWGMWWPASLRRPNDLWPRLPLAGRLVRVVLSLFIIGLPALILVREWIGARNGSSPDTLRPAFDAVKSAMLLGAGTVLAAAFAWALRERLSFSEAVRMLLGATTPSPGWSKPAVARLLMLSPGGLRSPDRDSAPDLARAIAALVGLRPSLARAEGIAVIAASRRVAAAVERCDAETASLAEDAGDAELERLTRRARSLEDGAADGERAELLELTRRQLDLVSRMRVRRELLAHRRARLLALLRGLWMQLSQASSGEASPNAGVELDGRLHDLVAECDAEAGAR